MNKKRFFLTIGLSFAIVMVLSFYHLDSISAVECQIIRIFPGETPQSVKINPETLTISEGDCVVWFNASGGLIQVTFKGSVKKIANPGGFFESKEHMSTSWYNHGVVSSMQVMEKGLYEYTIKTKHTDAKEVVGKIEVK